MWKKSTKKDKRSLEEELYLPLNAHCKIMFIDKHKIHGQ